MIIEYNSGHMKNEVPTENKADMIQEVMSLVYTISDVEDLLNTLLVETQKIFRSDAASIYLHENGRLAIRYAQNTQSNNRISNVPFTHFSFEVNERSIAGYTVTSRNIINVPDAYNIPKDKPYEFNNQVDFLTNFTTKSILSIPLISMTDEVLGVMQIINPKDENNDVLAFTPTDEMYAEQLSTIATTTLEKSKLSRAIKLQKIMESERVLNSIQDVDILLEALLTEARSIVNADAGSIYVYEDGKLTIKYAQNETQLRKVENRRKIPFSSFSFDVNEKSIAGYSVVSRSILNIPDVYHLAEDTPYKFNKDPDIKTGYTTKAVLTIPLIAGSDEILGVLQIINPLNQQGEVVEFDTDAEFYLQHFAFSATKALERTRLTRAMVMRMIRMAGFRDPKETGSHVNRVASYSVEIYDQWAHTRNIPEEEQNKFRDTLKIAAMLHDVGKVGIPDTILKLPRKFTPEEYDIIRTHTCIGAMLFETLESSIDDMALDVALHHHERWDGEGYPGNINVKKAVMGKTETMLFGEPISGESIPLAARIVSLADVYDALSSKRVYKDAWDHDAVLNEIRSQSGKQFDPEVVTAFMEILPDIDSIYHSFPEELS